MPDSPIPIGPSSYDRELRRLQGELVRLQYWIRERKLKVVVLFEGRNAAGKGGVIRRITRHTSHQVIRTVALSKPTEREVSQWYFQRYVQHLPGSGEMVLFDRSWYNRAGVERVMGFCTPGEVQVFLEDCPRFEKMLVDAGILLIKYWFVVGDEEQERRFQARHDDIRKIWKLSDIDLEERARWEEYAHARDEMFAHCHTEFAPWYVIDADHKELARLHCIRHLLAQIPYEDLLQDVAELPPRETNGEAVVLKHATRVPVAYRWDPDA